MHDLNTIYFEPYRLVMAESLTYNAIRAAATSVRGAGRVRRRLPLQQHPVRDGVDPYLRKHDLPRDLR